MIADDKSVYAELFDKDTTPEFGRLSHIPVASKFPALYQLIIPQTGMRPNWFISGSTASRFSSHIFKIDVDPFTQFFQAVFISRPFEGHMI